jgi:hypothetical protein
MSFLGVLSVESAIVIQARVDIPLPMVMFWHLQQEPPMIPDLIATRPTIRHDAHRAPDPAPVEEPPPDPFENADPHQPPIRTPQNDEPPIDPNPSILH